MADQIQRSGTAIGANHREATFAESDSDFIHKLQIAQKECGETIYWLELLKATEYISEELFNSLYTDAEEIMRMLTSSIMTTRKRLKNNDPSFASFASFHHLHHLHHSLPLFNLQSPISNLKSSIKKKPNLRF